MVAAPAAADEGYFNPVFPREFPDPAVLSTGHGYFAYGTSVKWDGRWHLFPILRSPDLVHWRHVGDAFRRKPRWVNDRLWAPAPLRHQGRSYLFYGARNRHGRHCIAVADSRRPAGPFRHRSVVACGRSLGYIDPFPLVQPDGSVLLYLARADPTCRAEQASCFISVIPLSGDLLHPAGPRTILLNVTEPWEAGPGYQTVENPFVLHSGGLYYLLYSANDWRSNDYAMGYAVGPTALGPFTKAASPLLKKGAGVFGPGGGSVVVGPNGGFWLVYHGRRRGQPDERVRTLHIDPLEFADGVLRAGGPTLGLTLDP